MMSRALHEKPEMTNTRADFYGRMAEENMTPLWEVLHTLLASEPVTDAIPYKWDYDVCRPYIMESADVISAEEAERRVLVLQNPGMEGRSCISESLYGGLQLIMPGEIAPAHRHSPCALRFIVEGTGAYTAINGEKSYMEVGDLILTPSWVWHDHGHDGDVPVVWLDVLDTPLVDLLDTVFRENYPAPQQQISRPDGDAAARFGAGMLPVGFKPENLNSPVFNYPYARSREALEAMRKAERWDPCDGLKMQYSNPTTGDHAIPTMGAFMQLLPKGFDGAPLRTTESAIYCVVEGRGKTVVEDQTIEWGPRDLFVIPGWRSHRHQASEDAILFSVSDRPMQTKFGLWREERPGEQG